MSNSHRQLNAANPKNLKPIQLRQKSIGQSSEVYPTNKAYLSTPQQSAVKEFNRDKMIEQNKKLKKQVLQLVQQMNQIVSKTQKKKKYGINIEEDLEGISEVQRLEAKKQEIRIMELKNQIFGVKKENQYVWDEASVIEKQNAIKALEAEMKPLQIEKTGLLKVRKEQEKALNFLKNDDKYNQKIEKSRSQLLKLKEQCKILASKTQQNERLLLKSHEKVVSKSKKIKQIEERIKQNKQKLKKGPQNIVTIEMIGQIEQEIMKLQTEYKQLQKSWTEKINNIEVQHANRKVEEEKKLIILKEKEREVKLNDIRLKQFRKLVVQNKAENKLASNQNMREFRNKRNIKYLEKSEA